jgi:hypothetical protein
MAMMNFCGDHSVSDPFDLGDMIQRFPVGLDPALHRDFFGGGQAISGASVIQLIDIT